jgi:cytochrome c biogenesis protein CcmG, thiol:disulfide interchange protein DsbE
MLEVSRNASRRVPRSRARTGQDRTPGRLRHWLVLMGLGVACAALACSEPAEPGPPAPPFSLERVGGGQVSLEDLSGKLVLLDFWATWCTPCIQEIPVLNDIYAAHRGRGLEVIGIAIEDLEPPKLLEWMRERGVTYPVLSGTTEVAMQYDAETLPQHVLISTDGRILEVMKPGIHSRGELEAAIRPHLPG